MDRSRGGGTDRRRGRLAVWGLMPGGLSGRLVAAAAVLVILIGASFAGLLVAIVQLRAADEGVTRSVVQLRAADRLEQLLIDMETGLRGFVITHEERFLEPWNQGRVAFPAEAQEAQRQAADNPVQAARLRAITDAGVSYVEDYGVRLIEAARRRDPSASSVATTQAGKDRIDGLRAQFAEYADAERAIYLSRQDAADAATNIAAIGATIGLAASVLLIALFATYMARTVVRPVTRAAEMAERLAAGNLSTRMPETGTAEIATLEQSFNRLAASLEQSHAAQQRLLEQQSALRRVATLVAQGAAPDEVFRAVVRELADHLPARQAYLGRYEADETMTSLAMWNRDQGLAELPERLPLQGDGLTVRVWRTGTTARVDSYDETSGRLAEAARKRDITSSVGCPVVVGGKVWGVLAAATHQAEALPADAESWMDAFTELVGTAISNAAARAELAASRARVVAASDETRRRIERNLHDGAQQRLVSVGLWLRSVESAIRPEDEEVGAGIRRVAAELNGVIDDLREISRGIYPAILSRGGLNSAIRTLARRSSIPVELDLRAELQPTEPILVAAYYVVAEALTNAAKHATAEKIRVTTEDHDGVLRVAVEDEGVGGADPARGSGLTGLRDRVESQGGRLEVASPHGEGTRLIAEFPLPDRVD
jgi:signal transduction histidine kinase